MGYVTRRNRHVLILVPLLILKEFYRVPEADSMSSVLDLHEKPVYRFSQTRKIICVRIFVSYNRYFVELPTLFFFAKAQLGNF